MNQNRKEELSNLKARVAKQENLPEHVAIIMDGNGRWAKSRELPLKDGHAAGVKTVKKMVKISREIGISILTLYTFSSQNWRRPRFEVKALMKLLSDSAQNEVDELVEEGVKVLVSGDIAGLPIAQRKAMQMIMDRTSNGEKLILNLALNYGGREEIIHATKKIAEMISAGEITLNDIDSQLFSKNLYTGDLPDPDLIIRTSGEKRISNFLLWQIAYSELYITDTLWPDFDEVDFLEAIIDFDTRDRRFGGRK